MTPVQAYSALRDEGYRVDYLRVPLTDGAAPRESIFDAFHQACQSCPLCSACEWG